MPLPRKDSPSSSRSERSAREPGFAQTARGPGPVGKMLSAALALANAVQFSACSGVLRVLGLARAGLSDGSKTLRVFLLRVFCPKDLIRSLGRRPDLSQLGEGRECGGILGLLTARAAPRRAADCITLLTFITPQLTALHTQHSTTNVCGGSRVVRYTQDTRVSNTKGPPAPFHVRFTSNPSLQSAVSQTLWAWHKAVMLSQLSGCQSPVASGTGGYIVH